jgi:hypothetical protein
MKQYTEMQSFKVSKKQKETLLKLKVYRVDVSAFIRIAIREKIGRDYKVIKESVKIRKLDCPF